MIIYLEKRKYKEEEVEKRGKRGDFHCTWRKNINLRKKRGEGQKYPIVDKYTPLPHTDPG